MYTEDLSKFGMREIKLAAKLLTAYSNADQNNTQYLNHGVKLAFNSSGGHVYLTDEEGNVAMMQGNLLCDWLISPHDSLQGFYNDMLEKYEDMHEEDKEWFKSL